jgi:hypothetical protein
MVCRVSNIEQRLEKKYTLPSVHRRHSAKHALSSVDRQSNFFPSGNAWRSAKVTVVNYRRLLTTLCRASPFADRVALGKEVFIECLSMPSVLHSVNGIVTESVILPSDRQKTLGKAPSTWKRAGFR